MLSNEHDFNRLLFCRVPIHLVLMYVFKPIGRGKKVFGNHTLITFLKEHNPARCPIKLPKMAFEVIATDDGEFHISRLNPHHHHLNFLEVNALITANYYWCTIEH